MGQIDWKKATKPLNQISEFKLLYNEHRKDVFSVALAILRDFEMAEDVLQEAFIKLYQHTQKNELKNVKAWLITVTRNLALDAYRKKSRELTGFSGNFFEEVHSVTGDPADGLVLAKYLELLDGEERQIVVMKDITGLKHREIAKILGLPLGTVLWKYRLALKKLRKGLEREGF